MVSANVTGDLSSEMEVDAFRRLFPLRYHERFLLDSIRPDARPLGRARDTSVALGWLKPPLAMEIRILLLLLCDLLRLFFSFLLELND